MGSNQAVIMASDSQKQAFIAAHIQDAKAVEARFGMNPVAILAQAALESEWGNSYSAKNRNNYFGMTVGSGKTSEFWNGENSQSSASGLWFRIYDSPKNSFMEFGNKIKNQYSDAYNCSYDIPEYAHKIAKSAYISEVNGDNRQDYENGIISNASYIAKFVPTTTYAEKPVLAKASKTGSIILGGIGVIIALICLYNLGVYYYPQLSISALWKKKS